ncbi:hypothetical protein [Liquorilactobacillus uvarum]|nr:hypothetical protein [Liquorilactobacillus uvarum]
MRLNVLIRSDNSFPGLSEPGLVRAGIFECIIDHLGALQSKIGD